MNRSTENGTIGHFSDWVDEDLAACCLNTTQRGLHLRLSAAQNGEGRFVVLFCGRAMEARYDDVFSIRVGCLPPSARATYWAHCLHARA